MEIHAKLGAGSVRPIVPSSTTKPATRPVADEVNFKRSAELTAALSATPEVRNEVIARLAPEVGHPSYPPRETLHRIAELLAINM
jgi:hypothetical protein